MSDETPAERVSRFREHTNTNSSIRAPPAELWKDVGLEALLDKFSDDSDKTPAVRRANHPRKIMEPTGHRKSPSNAAAAARKQSDAAATLATAEGTFGRFSRAFANVFGGVLGKRKHEPEASAADAAQAALDDRKRAAEEAYHLAKSQGLLPAPKVFVRPGMTPRASSADGPASRPTAAAPASAPAHDRAPGTPRPTPALAPRTPGSVARSPSKRDLSKQRKLSRRVSSLEVKLAEAKRELQSVLGGECFPAVPPLPGHVTTTDLGGGDVPSPNPHPLSDTAPLSPSAASLPGKITKKRKSLAVHDDDAASHPTPTASDADLTDADPLPTHHTTPKRPKRDATTRLKRTSSRLHRRVSRSSIRSATDDQADENIVVVKPGGTVPPVPVVPRDVEGGRVRVVGDDGYGGLGHEIF